MSPIQTTAVVDAVRRDKDGVVTLLIRTTSPLDGSEEVRRLVLAKLEHYLSVIQSDAFGAEWGKPIALQFLVECVCQPDPALLEALRPRMESWCKQNQRQVEIIWKWHGEGFTHGGPDSGRPPSAA